MSLSDPEACSFSALPLGPRFLKSGSTGKCMSILSSPPPPPGSMSIDFMQLHGHGEISGRWTLHIRLLEQA